MLPRLAVICTHPIQYYAPLFRRLAERERLDVHVFYEWEGASGKAAYDAGFGQAVRWDIPLLDGYSHTFVPNHSADPGTHHLRGLINPGLVPAIEAWEADAVLLFGWPFQSHLRALHSFRGRLPVFFRGDSTLLDERPGLRKLLRRLFLRFLYRFVDVALPVGQHSRAYFRTHGVQDAQLAWVPHAVENKRFRDADGTHAQRAQQWRQDLGIPPDAVAIVFAGKLGHKKAPGLLLEALRHLADPSVHLIYAGSGPLEEPLRSKVRPNENVHFIGFQNQSAMPAVYRLGNGFVLPSRGPGETWGLAVNEAMACGRPVVVSDRVGCAPDLVHDGRNGFVFPAGDATQLAAALRRLVAQGASGRAAMGRSSARLIAGWSIDHAARQLEDAVHSYLDDAPV